MASKKKKTGLGANPLDWIQDTTQSQSSSIVRELPLEQIIECDRFKLRLELPEVEALARDIEEKGQTTPVFVRPFKEDLFELISGYRRLEALRSLQAETILARVFVDLSDEEAERLAISENLQRRDLTDLEQANICLRLQEQGLKTKQIGRVVGKEDRTVRVYLAVAKAPRKVCDALQQGKISLYVAHELAQACKQERPAYICRPRDLAKVIKYVVEQEHSVRQVHEYLEQLADGSKAKEPEEQPAPKKRTRGPFQPVRFAEKKNGFDLVVKFRRKDDVQAIVRVLEETLERVRKERENY